MSTNTPTSHPLTNTHTYKTNTQASGLLQKVSASFFQKQVATGVKAYPAVGGDDGGVYVQLR